MPFMQRRPVIQRDSNTPSGTGLQHQYMADPAKQHLRSMAQYATDFFEAQVQGLEDDDAWKAGWYKIRTAAHFSSLNTSNMSHDDDWRVVYFERPDIDYIRPGTKFWFWNNCWLADNPANIASVSGNALVKRCNAVWNSLDYFGNIVSEPMVITRPNTMANANTDTETMKLADSYMDCIMQANPWTIQNLKNNTRMILGTSGFAVRGLSDYIREFTDQQDSVRVLRFSLYYQEPTERDDMKHQVADGLAFSWIVNVTGPRSIQAGEHVSLVPSSIRNGEAVADTIAVTYLWSSHSPEIATVDENGVVTGMANGQVIIRCTLKENPSIFTDTVLEVQDALTGLHWATDVPRNIPAYQSRKLAVAGEQGPVEWSFSGPDQTCYTAQIVGAQSAISCYYPSPVPLTVSITDGTATLTAEIKLTGS